MITVKSFEFNGFGVNTYVLINDNNNCVVVDPGCYTKSEQKRFDDFIDFSGLTIEKQLITHCHIDHILGIAHIEDKYGVGAWIHPAGKEFLRASVGYASVFGFHLERPVVPVGFIIEGEPIFLGKERFDVLYTPGHAEGSVCLVYHEQKMVFTGDVLFRESIGRTDLPTGNYDLLIKNIKDKLLTLGDDYTVYPGHMNVSTIGHEKLNNPYLE
ncbi:MAG: MBL fold metallo-hydrolase [Bacteroidales bacterium]|jgi:glyoxylase-like metal-dependent hydrolase (beta-lactamase superfamily II)|nr:MBL fold metallo-hydrolase [Bacteroidales bacterium]